VYRQRVARGETLGVSRSAAVGHATPGEPSLSAATGRGFGEATFFDAESGTVLVLDDATASDMRRAGRYMNLTRQLREGAISEAEFRRRVSRWAPIRGRQFLADPQRALALAITTDRDDIIFRYLRGRDA